MREWESLEGGEEARLGDFGNVLSLGSQEVTASWSTNMQCQSHEGILHNVS